LKKKGEKAPSISRTNFPHAYEKAKIVKMAKKKRGIQENLEAIRGGVKISSWARPWEKQENLE